MDAAQCTQDAAHLFAIDTAISISSLTLYLLLLRRFVICLPYGHPDLGGGPL